MKSMSDVCTSCGHSAHEGSRCGAELSGDTHEGTRCSCRTAAAVKRIEKIEYDRVGPAATLLTSQIVTLVERQGVALTDRTAVQLWELVDGFLRRWDGSREEMVRHLYHQITSMMNLMLPEKRIG